MASVRIVASLLLSLCLLWPLTQAIDIRYCNKKAYAVKVSGVDISPYPVSRGVSTTFAISASSGDAITGGKMTIDVSYFGFHIHSESQDLCEKTSCPIPAGDFVLSHEQVLPGFTPPGTYTLTMKMVDGDNHQLTCITFDFSIWFGEAEPEAISAI